MRKLPDNIDPLTMRLKRFKCLICGEYFKYQPSLESHQRQHKIFKNHNGDNLSRGSHA